MKIPFLLLLICYATIAPAQTPHLVIPIGHSDEITAAAISPDEKYVLTGSNDETAILWNIGGKEMYALKKHSGAIIAVAFLYKDNDKFALTADRNGSVNQWDLSGNHIRTFYHAPVYHHGRNWVSKIVFSPEGGTVCIQAHNYFHCTDILNPPREGEEANQAEEQPVPPFFENTPERVSGKNYTLTFEGKTATLWSQNGKNIRSYTGHSAEIESAAFSPADGGKFILTGSADGRARLWSMTNGAVIRHFKGGPTALFASTAGEQAVLTGSTDETTLWWNWNGALSRSFDGGSPEAISPDGNFFLAGATLWDRTTGKAQKVDYDTPKPKQRPASTGDEPQPIRFEAPGFSPPLPGDFPTFSAAFSPPTPDDPKGGKYFLTGSTDLKLWNRADCSKPVKVFMRESGGFGLDGASVNPDAVPIRALAVAFSPDGKSVLAADKEVVTRWNIQSGEIMDDFQGHHERVNAIAVTKAANGGLYVLAGSNDNTAKLWDPANNVVKQEAMSARQLGDPIGSEFIGGEIQTYSGHTNDVTVVAFSPATSGDPLGGKYVLTGSRDNTAKIWDRTTGKEIATLIALDDTEWAVTTPAGLFDASPGAMNLMHFVVGTEVVDLEQLKERYYEPGLLGKLLGLNQDPLRSVEAFSAVPLYPDMNTQLSEDKMKLQVNLTPRNGGIGKLSVFINGKEVLEDANPQRAQSLNIDLAEFAEYYLPGENNLIALRVYNQAGWLKSAALELNYQPPATARGNQSGGTSQPVLKGKPSLFAVVVGTSDYAGEKLDLKFADHDATSFTLALRAASPKVFGDRVTITLLNTDATDKNRQDISTKTNIQKAFADIATKAQAQDILIIYFSGHGVNYGAAESGQFYYLTKDIASENLGDPEIRKNYAISSNELTEWIKAIPALKQVMILDACNSGKIVQDLAAGRKDLNSSQIRAIDRMKDRTGMFILTGSAADKVSYEAGEYGQGLLTYSLLQGMSGLALTADKRVDVMTLFQYSRDRVPELAKGIGGIQTPILAFPNNSGSFDIGIVDEQVKISLAEVKPVFIRNVFQDEESFDDVLGLTTALAGYFQQITLQGTKASLIYVDVAEYENAYSIKGRYKVNGGDVEVRGKLFKGKAAKGEFLVTGKKSDLPGLVEAIVEKVSGMVE